ncbi:MAG: anaerobic ribonucleoside-triphosphate reductase activating protein [bacterium]
MTNQIPISAKTADKNSPLKKGALKINLHNFIPQSRANGPGERAVVWVQGCSRNCPGCFNPKTHSFAEKEIISVEELENRITAIQKIDGVTFSGGEPFEQASALAELAKRLREKGMTVVCYTGYTFEELRKENRDDWNRLLEQVDLLIDGPFVQSKRNNEPNRGSSNQKIYFLSGRIQPEEISGARRIETFLDSSGQITTTGFPEISDMDAMSEFLGK